MKLMRAYVRPVANAVAVLLLAAGAPIPGLAAPAPGSDVDRLLNHYDLVTIDAAAARSSVKATGRFTLDAGGREFEIELAARDMRGARYRSRDVGADGIIRTQEKRRSEVRTFAGTVANVAGATARFTLDGGRLTGMIIAPDETYFVEPLADFSPAGGPTDYVFYRGSDVNSTAIGDCGSTLAQKISSAEDHVSKAAHEALVAQNRIVDIATEADFDYVSALGGSANANNEILSVMNQVEGVYQNEVGLAFNVVFQNTWSSSSDPYASTDPSTMLNEFTSYWNSNFTNVQRDMAHMWTGRDMNGSTIGIAWIGVICQSPSNAYGVSQRMTTAPQEYILTAHEIGHNFSASHSDAQGGCSNTIMQSSVGTGFTFCQFSRNEIATWVTGHTSCVSLIPTSTIGAYNSLLGVFYLRDSNDAGNANAQFQFGAANAGWKPITGDWDGNKTATAGLYNPANGVFYLKNANAGGNADMQFGYGPAGANWIPIAGDWDGNNTVTVGLYNPSNGVFYLRNANSGGNADLQFQFGPPNSTWVPIAGDWNGDGKDTIGLYDPATGVFYLRNSNDGGPASLQFQYGPPGSTPVAGDWSGLGRDTVGIYSGVLGVFYLRNTNTAGPADAQFPFGPLGMAPLGGDWNGL